VNYTIYGSGVNLVINLCTAYTSPGIEVSLFGIYTDILRCPPTLTYKSIQLPG
jgi:hypothetical protein